MPDYDSPAPRRPAAHRGGLGAVAVPSAAGSDGCLSGGAPLIPPPDSRVAASAGGHGAHGAMGALLLAVDGLGAGPRGPRQAGCAVLKYGPTSALGAASAALHCAFRLAELALATVEWPHWPFARPAQER